MVFPFDRALQGIGARFDTMQGGGSPFGQNPFGAASPFSAGMGGMQGPQFQGFGAGGGPQFGGFGAGQSPFGQSPFGNMQSPFGNAFGAGSTPFGQPSWGTILNPWTYTEDPDPLGTGGAGNGGGVDFTGPATADDNRTLNGGAIDNWVRSERSDSPLVGMGNFILQEANRQGVSVPLVLGIMRLESQLGADGSYLPSVHNYGGLTGTGWAGQTGSTTGMARQFATFATKEDGIRALIANLATARYKGKSIQQQIGLWYLGDENASLTATDEHGNATMAQYLSVVERAYQGLGIGYNATQGGVPRAGGATRDNWEATARSFTREGGGWVDYTNGGIRVTGNPQDGMDCSSFTGYVLGLDRNIWTAQAQANAAQSRGTRFYDQSQAKKGDLIFFHSTYDTGRGERVTHVGIYLGNGMMIHTGTPGRGVEVVSMNTQYWKDHFDGFGRL